MSIGLLAIGLVSLARHLPLEQALTALEGWMDDLGPWGPLAFGLIYVAAVVLMAPAFALTMAGGALFGPVLGAIVVSIASNVGAAMAFLIARHAGRAAVARRARESPRFGAIDRAIGEGGWKIVALLRLSPAVPFNVQNYLYGLTRIGFWPCVAASWIAMLPGTFLYVYLGYIGREGLQAAAGSGRARTPAEWGLTAAGLCATIAVTAYLTRLARRAMRDQRELLAEHESTPSAPQNIFGTAALALLALIVVAAALAVEFRPGRRDGQAISSKDAR